MKEIYRKLIESYNTAIERGYNKFFEEGTEDEVLAHDESKIKLYLDEAINKWNTSSLVELDGKSPLDFISGIDDFKDMLEIYRLAAVKCDDWVPTLVIDKLREYGDKAIDEVIKFAFNENLEDDDEFYIALASLKLLGYWKVTGVINSLVSLISEGTEADEGVLDMAKGALVDMGASAIDDILDELEKNLDDINNEREYLLEVLTEIPEARSNDRVFKCLKNSFLSMENKVIGAIILGQFGDSRAIPALRGYAEKNLSTIDRETFYEIKFAVESLGGNMDDLVFE